MQVPVSKRIRQIFGTKLVHEFVNWTDECEECLGQGIKLDSPCPYCDGKGELLTDVAELVRYIQQHCPPNF